ncbi:MAG: ferritin-like domain-containing protein [Devosia sp.]
MNIQDNFILDEIDPDLGERIDAGRRNLFARYAAPAIALGSAPLLLAAASTEAFAAGALPQKVVDVLNFALTLEYLEAAFYKMGNEANGLIPSEYRALFHTIGGHETAHVALLKSALGAAAVKAPAVDFTAGGKYADVFSNFKTFATLSATFEDLGVAAYKGQAGNLAGTAVLTTALQIHSVEARHASAVRPLIGKAGYISAFDKPKTKAQVLAAAKPFLA